MLSHEIDALLRENNYNILSTEYIRILDTSPQIIKSRFNPYRKNYEIYTDDNYHWEFRVHHGRKED